MILLGKMNLNIFIYLKVQLIYPGCPRKWTLRDIFISGITGGSVQGKHALNRVIPGICGVIFTRSTFGTPALGLRHKLQHPGHLRAVRWTLRYNYNIEAANGNVHTENLCRNMSMNND